MTWCDNLRGELDAINARLATIKYNLSPVEVGDSLTRTLVDLPMPARRIVGAVDGQSTNRSL